MEYLSHIKNLPIEFIYGFVAVVGGIARYLNAYAEGHPFVFNRFVASAFVAGFSGYMFALLGESMNLPMPIPHILAGVGGFFGDQTMSLIMEYLTSSKIRIEKNG